MLRESLLQYNSEDQCLVLDGRTLVCGDSIAVRVLDSWLPGKVTLDKETWYLLTSDQVRICLHAGMPAYVRDQPAPPSTTRVLIVDDDIALLQALPRTIMLRLSHVRVDTADSAQEALQHMQEHHYDAIVSDIKMPGMDGLALLEKIQEIQPEVPAILITGHSDQDMAIQALRGGAYDYILKPIDRDVFVAALQRAIQTCQLRHQVDSQRRALEMHAKSLEDLVQQRTQELLEANAMKDKVISLVTHELNVPLVRLKDMARLLQRKLQGLDMAELVHRGFTEIENSIARLEGLIQELLTTSRIEAHMFIPQRQRCNMLDLCSSILEEQAKKFSASLSCALLDEHAEVEVEVDGDQVRQVLTTLLSPARMFSASDVPVTITLQRTSREAIMAVRSLTSQADLGLSFYIARKIIERQGGRLEVQSFPGDSTTVFTLLPLALEQSPSLEPNGRNLQPHICAEWTLQYTENTVVEQENDITFFRAL